MKSRVNREVHVRICEIVGVRFPWAIRLGGGRKPPVTRLAIRLESIVKSDGALRSMPVERQSEEDLLWYSLMHKAGYILEPELPVVIRMPHETTSLSLHIFQS